MVPNSLQSSSESSANTPKEGSSGNVTSTNSHNQQQPSNDNDGRAKRKTIVHGRGRGIGAVPKSKNSAVPGWTGAGFEWGILVQSKVYNCMNPGTSYKIVIVQHIQSLLVFEL